MADTHIGENAELYALGELNELERMRVERHAGSCADCSARLGEAEATLLRLIESGKMPDSLALDRRTRYAQRANAPAWIAGVAAAFLLGLLPWGITSLRERATIDSAHQAQLAMHAMLAGHFLHAPFAARAPGAPAAKVVYAREGGWLYVIAAPGSDPLSVVVIAGGKRATVASLPAATVVRSVFINQPTPVEAVELVDRGTPIAVAHIVYAARTRR
jgi:anti-sigma factor RsiW